MKLNMHHAYALVLVALAAVQMNLGAIHDYVSGKTFGWLTMGVGIAVGVFGFLKSDNGS